MSEMRVLTVRQPWAWAIVHGGKDVENRVRNIAGSYRGPVAIHAGLGTDVEARDNELLSAVWAEAFERGTAPSYPPKFPGRDRKRSSIYLEYGAILGVVDLVDVHAGWVEGEQCSVWSERYAEHDGCWHLVFANPRPLSVPIPFKGALGLRRLPGDVAAQVWAGVTS